VPSGRPPVSSSTSTFKVVGPGPVAETPGAAMS
jgi:hypothetical protein